MKHLLPRLMAVTLIAGSAFGASAQVFTVCEQNSLGEEKVSMLSLPELQNLEYTGGTQEICINPFDQPVNKAPANADATTAKVTFDKQFDTDVYSGSVTVYVFNNDYTTSSTANSMTIPVGTYEIMGRVTVKSGGYAYLIKEQIEIIGDTTITLDFSECKHKYVRQVYLPNGDLRVKGVNADNTYDVDALVLKGYGYVTQLTSNDYYTNDLSNRYLLTFTSLFRVGTDRYVCKASVTGDQATDETVYIANNAEDWVAHEETFVPTPDNQLNGEGYKVLTMFIVWDSNITMRVTTNLGSFDLTENDVYRLYANTPKSDNGSYDVLSVLQFMEAKNKGYISSAPMLITKDGVSYENTSRIINGNGNFYFEANRTYLPNGKKWPFPGHPQLSYTDKEKALNFGSNVPVNAFRFLKFDAYWDEEEEYTLQNYVSVQCCNIGRYGETRNTDSDVFTTEVKLNDSIINTDYATLNTYLWDQARFYDGIKGVLDMLFINQNIVVDSLAGMNRTHIHCDLTKDDWAAPTVVMLTFKDKDGKVIDRFNSGDDGVLMFTAGDFNLDSSLSWFNCDDQTVEVNYSPYAQDDWQNLAVEEIADNFYLPTFGYFYQSSLKDVEGKGENGWFDLKIKLTDASGNWQEQVISPAFCLKDHKSNSVSDVFATDGTTEVEAIYSVDGCQLSEMQQGINIVRYTNGTARKVLVK